MLSNSNLTSRRSPSPSTEVPGGRLPARSVSVVFSGGRTAQREDLTNDV